MHRSTRPQAGAIGRQVFQSRRELIRVKRRRNDRTLLYMILAAPVLFLMAYHLGRSVYYMHDVRNFAAAIEQMPPDQVKNRVRRYAADLTSPNLFVRNGAITALKIATGWNYGANGFDWQNRWNEEEPYWEYRPRSSTNMLPTAGADWRKSLPVAVTNPPATPIPAP